MRFLRVARSIFVCFPRRSLFFSRFESRHGFVERLLRSFMRPPGVFHGLLGVLVAGQMIFFAMMRGSHAVSVRGEFVKFSSSLV
jgi:hypothetical protein